MKPVMRPSVKQGMKQVLGGRTASDAVGAPTAGDPYVPTSGNGGYRITHYDLTLDYRLATNRLAGRALLTASTTQPLRAFSLDLAGLDADKVAVNGGRVRRFSQRDGKLRIELAAELPGAAELRVDIRYSGQPHPVSGPWGDVGFEELTEGVIVAGQPNGAPSWFPCNDHPSEKASYRIEVTTDSPYTVVSNGDLFSRRVRASQTTWTFTQDEPMATYLATLQIGRYESTTLATEPVPQAVLAPAAIRARVGDELARQPKMMALFEDRFGRFPYHRYTVVVTDDELEIPLEAQGLSVFGSNYLAGRRTHERLVAHELAHQWFGNALTVARWRDIWLNEGFACYAEWLWSEQIGDTSAQKLARRYHERLGDASQDLVLADPGPESMFDDRVYKRGACTLHALRARLGDAVFFDLLRSWVAGRLHKTVTTEAFVAHSQTFSAEPLDDFFRSWLYETELPALPSPRRGR